MERTLVLVKPDGVKRALTGRVISRFEMAGLKVVGIKMVSPSRELAGKHYSDDENWLSSVGTKAKRAYKEGDERLNKSDSDIGRLIRNQLIDSLAGEPVVAMVLEGNEAAFAVRKIAGSTDPKGADPSSIRGMYSTDSYANADGNDRPIRNIIHASEDKDHADLEIALWFDESEFVEYKRVDDSILA